MYPCNGPTPFTRVLQANGNHVGISLGNNLYIGAGDVGPGAHYGQSAGVVIKTEEAGLSRIYRDVQE